MSDKATYLIDLNDSFSPKLKNASGNLDAFENKLGKIGGSSGSGGLMGGFAAAAVGAFAIAGAAVLGFAGKALSLGMELEQTKVAMNVLVGDAQKADQLFGQMTNFANATPFANSDIIDASKLLLSFGTDVKDIMPTVAMLGDVSMGNADKLHSLTLAFAQMSSTGKLTGQDLLQMINAGFNPLKTISDQTGRSIGQLKKDMEAGAISSDMVKNAFVAATSEGGLFFGMMDKQSKTMSGMWSTFTGTLEHAMATFGMKMGPTVVKVIGWLNSGLEALLALDFSPWVSTFTQIWGLFSDLGSVFMDLVAVFMPLTESSLTLQDVFDGLAFNMRVMLTPLRFLLEGLKLLWMTAGVVADVFTGMGKVMIGVFTRDFAMVKEGIDQTMSSAQDGMKSLADEISAFGKKEKQGWIDVMVGGKSKKADEVAEVERFGLDKTAFSAVAGKGKKDSKVDGEVRSGGVKNITINIGKLVEKVTFESMNKLSENQLTEIVKRALLTAVNDANVAVQ